MEEEIFLFFFYDPSALLCFEGKILKTDLFFYVNKEKHYHANPRYLQKLLFYKSKFNHFLSR